MSDVDQDEGLSAEVQAYQAKEVQQFLKHPGILKAFAETEAEIIHNWTEGTALSPLEREMLWHEFQAFRKFRRRVRAVGDRRPTLTVSG